MTKIRLEPIAEDEMRVLELFPGEGDSLIRATTKVVSLSSKPEYEALSYVWGSPRDTTVIEVSGVQVQITTSLHSALHRLRHAKTPRLLWIDQLCIDQENMEEKAAEVRKMRVIYSQCSRCILWMGEIGNHIQLSDAENAIGFLEYLATDEGTSNMPETAVYPALFKSPTGFRKAMEALYTITTNVGPWWQRAWTVQEAILPKDRLLLWGPLSCTWDKMTSAAGKWVSPELESVMPSEVFSICYHSGEVHHLVARIIWINATGGYESDPMASMLKWRDRQATDLVDNVYALTGLHLEGVMPRSEKCDYSLSPARVFSDFTMDLIDLHGLFTLVFDTQIEDDIRTPGVPSWALDMRSWPKYRTNHWHLNSSYWWYSPSGDLPLVEVKYDPKGTLDISGWFVDKVKSVGPECRILPEEHIDHVPEDLQPATRTPILSVLRSWWGFLTDSSNIDLTNGFTIQPEDEATFTEFCRLLIGNHAHDDKASCAECAIADDLEAIKQFLTVGTRAHWIESTVKPIVMNQKLFVTEKGMMGLGSMQTLPGDEIWVFSGANFPFLIRNKDVVDEGIVSYDFMGKCYVQGIMDGETVPEDPKDIVQTTIRIW